MLLTRHVRLRNHRCHRDQVRSICQTALRRHSDLKESRAQRRTILQAVEMSIRVSWKHIERISLVAIVASQVDTKTRKSAVKTMKRCLNIDYLDFGFPAGNALEIAELLSWRSLLARL
jgi:hypothetical protein